MESFAIRDYKARHIKSANNCCDALSTVTKPLTKKQIVDLHNHLKTDPNRDEIAYAFYSQKRDVAMGYVYEAMAIDLADSGETKAEMLKEVSRLASESSSLSEIDKLNLRHLYANYNLYVR